MTQAKPRFSTFEEYLSFDDGSDNRYELIDGELVALPPESEPNDWIAQELFWLLANAGLLPRRLIRPHSCEVQVPVLQPKDAANRYPDLVVLDEAHLSLTQKRLTIKLDMPPPQLVAEVLSPGKPNRVRETSLQENRDLIRKRAQYAARGIPEYWLIDPERQTVTVLVLQAGNYAEVGSFKGDAAIVSPSLKELNLAAEQVLSAGEQP